MTVQIMRNRHGEFYSYKKVNENTYTICGKLSYWRYGGREGQPEMDLTNLGFVDPSGGPFIELGMKIEGRTIKNINASGDQILFEVE